MSNKQKPERITSQKKIILDYLKGVTSHPSAEEIYKQVKKKLPRISQGTVYRVLNNLKEKGDVNDIPAAGASRFNGDTAPHAHLICLNCHRIFDILDVCSACSVLKNKRVKVGRIKNYKIYFYGICKHCEK